jgi:hypothetical protein
VRPEGVDHVRYLLRLAELTTGTNVAQDAELMHALDELIADYNAAASARRGFVGINVGIVGGSKKLYLGITIACQLSSVPFPAPPIFRLPISRRVPHLIKGSGGASVRDQWVATKALPWRVFRQRTAEAAVHRVALLAEQLQGAEQQSQDGAGGVNLDNRGSAKERFERHGRYPVFQAPG